jgi:hypothetical protein
LNLGPRAYNGLHNYLPKLPDGDILKCPWARGIKNFGAASFRETIQALILYGIPRERIESSSFWQTAPRVWRRNCLPAAAGTTKKPDL